MREDHRNTDSHGRGVPDGLFVAVLCAVMYSAIAVWSSAELGGLITHGHWPRLQFSATPTAIHHLARRPHDIAAAWPAAASARLPGATVFWCVLTGQLVAVAALALLLASFVLRRHLNGPDRRRERRPAHRHHQGGSEGR